MLQIDTKIFWCVWWSISEVPKKASLHCLYNIPKKLRDEGDFSDADKQQSLLTVDFNTLVIKVFYNVTGMIMKTYRTWWWEWSSILKVPKVTSLKCLYNISKKEFSNFDVKLSIFDESSQTCPKYRKKEFVKFLQYVTKNYCICFCVLLWSKTFRYFTRFQSFSLLLIFGWLWSKKGVAF